MVLIRWFYEDVRPFFPADSYNRRSGRISFSFTALLIRLVERI